MYLLSRFFVAKNKVMETDLQQLNYAKTPCKGQLKVVLQSHLPLQHIMSQGNLIKQQVLSFKSFFLFQVPFNVATKTFLSHPCMQK